MEYIARVVWQRIRWVLMTTAFIQPGNLVAQGQAWPVEIAQAFATLDAQLPDAVKDSIRRTYWSEMHHYYKPEKWDTSDAYTLPQRLVQPKNRKALKGNGNLADYFLREKVKRPEQALQSLLAMYDCHVSQSSADPKHIIRYFEIEENAREGYAQWQHTTDNLSGHYIPENPRDACFRLDAWLSVKDRARYRAMKSAQEFQRAGDSLGRRMQRDWGLDHESRLAFYYQRKGITDPKVMLADLMITYFGYLQKNRQPSTRRYLAPMQHPPHADSLMDGGRHLPIMTTLHQAVLTLDKYFTDDIRGDLLADGFQEAFMSFYPDRGDTEGIGFLPARLFIEKEDQKKNNPLVRNLRSKGLWGLSRLKRCLMAAYWCRLAQEPAAEKNLIRYFSNEITDDLEHSKWRYETSNIYGHYIPCDLGECFNQLDQLLDSCTKESIRCGELGPAQFHFGLGMWMRNNWGFWGGSRLQTFLTDIGKDQPDDMSWFVIETYVRRLRNEPLGL